MDSSRRDLSGIEAEGCIQLVLQHRVQELALERERNAHLNKIQEGDENEDDHELDEKHLDGHG